MAARQWGILDVHDLRACGLSDDAILTRVRTGRLFPIHRGVYAIGHPNLSLEARFLAAVRACGPDAALSHFSAAVLYGWFRWDDRFPEVTARNARKHAGINTHRSNHIERTVIKAIPVTPPARTLTDLSSMLPFKPLRRAVNEALNQRLIKPHQLVTTNHRGARQLRRILATAAPTRNEYEDLVNALLHEAGLPSPAVNQRRGRYIPDFRWPEHHLILEADSERFHGHILARADDARRQADLEAEGETVIRTTWHEAVMHPQRMIARVKAALGVT